MKTPIALLLILLFVSGIFSSCKNHFTFNGVVVDEVSKQPIGNAVIRYNINPQIYPYNDDSFQVVGSSGSDGHYSVGVKTEYDFGYLVAEKDAYWCPASFGIDWYDTIHLFRESWLRITLHDSPGINITGQFNYSLRRYYSSTDWLNIGNNVEVYETKQNIPVSDGEVIALLLAGDMDNGFVIGCGIGNTGLMDTTLIVHPAWGGAFNLDFDY